MNYQTFQPQPDLDALIKCYWILEVPEDPNTQKQRIVPDGCIEMIFTLGDDVERCISDDEVITQPRAMILGQITQPFYIKPTGAVNTFAIRFYPYGFSNFVKVPIATLANKETPIADLFGEPAKELEKRIIAASSTEQRIKIAEDFLLGWLRNQTNVDDIVKTTIDTLLQTKGNASIHAILKDEMSKRRTLERKFSEQVGISPKQLGKIIRIQTALQMLLNDEPESLTKIAYESEYYDQAHFIKDFKEFTGINPKDFLTDDQMVLSTLFYSEE